MRHFSFWALFISLGLSSPGFAQQATPNHVFQSVEETRLVLLELNEANFSKSNKTVQAQSGILPRHVYQKARDVWRKLQLLRYMNGLPTQALEPLEAKDISPADVKQLVDKINTAVVDLLPSYGVDGELPKRALPSGKSPSDVYQNLAAVLIELDALGVPATVPNDVFVVAKELTAILRVIADNNSASYALDSLALENGKTPGDVYQLGIDVIADLNQLAEQRTQFQVPGGINVPPSKADGVTPSDVIDLLAHAIADANAIKAALGIKEPGQAVRFEGGKTPSDVYLSLRQARHIIATLAS